MAMTALNTQAVQLQGVQGAPQARPTAAVLLKRKKKVPVEPELPPGKPSAAMLMKARR